MSYRIFSSLTLALAGFVASTGVSFAAIDNQDDVMLVTGATVAVFLAIVSTAALVKHLFGLDKAPPPEPDTGGAHH